VINSNLLGRDRFSRESFGGKQGGCLPPNVLGFAGFDFPFNKTFWEFKNWELDNLGEL
jgi:hypothetical protein